MRNEIRKLGKFFIQTQNHLGYQKLAQVQNLIPDLKDTHFGTASEQYQKERLEIDPEIIDRIKKEKIGTLQNYQIYFVNGTEIRNWIDPDFVGGGNDSRYRYIPDYEIWIEEGTPKEDVLPYIIHEQSEAELMKEQKLSYEEAHQHATEKEWMIRHYPEERAAAEKLLKN